MPPLPNLAESRIADAIRAQNQPGFETVLAALFHTVAAPDNLIYLAYRDAGAPQVLYRQTLDPTVFAELESTYLPGAYRLDPFFDLHLNRVAAGAYRLTDIAAAMDRGLGSASMVVNFDNETHPVFNMSGTSMSGPFVAGVIALMLQRQPGMTPAQALASATTVNATGGFLDTHGAPKPLVFSIDALAAHAARAQATK